MSSSYHNLQYKICVGILQVLMHSLFKIEFVGLDRLPSSGPVILVSNHQSYLDVPLIGCMYIKKKLIWKNYWVIGKTTFNSKVLNWFYSCCPTVVVNGTVKAGEAVLSKGYVLTVFPEGFYAWSKHKLIRAGSDPSTLTRKIGSSAAILALKTGLPIIPIGLCGTEEALPPFETKPKRGKLSLHVGEPIILGKPEPEEVTDEMIAEKSKLIMDRIDALSQKYA